ncbi:cupredoxin domain-containing protein [Rhodohalobacter sulfatireducens]|uniref:Cupredoxin domain-containing protein n=1 Tax=Rhodohalobacter sulfatireducens TaxID=2911366 RepID=A0ABS9KJL6_9BACT|nr:cupredoxin domain-containing protein [Rhodohalobacter sulfatireducens]MCG2591045.1 cupredoxin domain-containing protein [Rhodohalobacter sulfatireducens]
MPKRIAIDACNFVRAVNRGNAIIINSKDQAYTVTSSSQGVFEPNPLTIPAKKSRTLTIRNDAPSGTYTLELICDEDDDIVRPTMIIKVE